MTGEPRGPQLTRWTGAEPPIEQAIERIFREARLSPSRWSNGPGDRYAAHSHSYHKVLYCLRGSIRFTCILETGEHAFDLAPGDRLDIPAGLPHSAIVGPQGVACMEA